MDKVWHFSEYNSTNCLIFWDQYITCKLYSTILYSSGWCIFPPCAGHSPSKNACTQKIYESQIAMSGNPRPKCTPLKPQSILFFCYHVSTYAICHVVGLAARIWTLGWCTVGTEAQLFEFDQRANSDPSPTFSTIMIQKACGANAFATYHV